MAFSRDLLTVAAIVGIAAAQNKTKVTISIPSDLNTRLLVPDVYGYSIEPVWLDSYINTSLASTLLGSIAKVTGKAPPIRVGGNTADQTYLYPSSPLPLTGNNSVAIPDPMNATSFNITPRWFSTWATYFPAGTDLIYTLNFADNSSGWANAVAQAEAAHDGLGDGLVAFELGNEIDHFINKGWRDASWGVDAYIEQFRNLTGQITDSEWYRALTRAGSGNSSNSNNNNNDNNSNSNSNSNMKGKKKGNKKAPPTFQAAVLADPPLIPDQQDELDDFSIANLTAAGIASRPAERGIISSYATHLYPQSTCDAPRRARLSLDLLSDHAVLWQNVSQYIPQIAAAADAAADADADADADAAGGDAPPLVMGETNSASCSGRSGISDTQGAALWAVDYVLTAASLGFRRLYFHLGARSEYAAFTPRGYELEGEALEGGIRSTWYAHYFIARVVVAAAAAAAVVGRGVECRGGGGGEGTTALRVAALPGANSSELSGFAIYGGSGGGAGGEARDRTVRRHEEGDHGALRKLVFLDMGVWNGTEGLSNPSTLSATDGTVFSEGSRPVSAFEVATPWSPGVEVGVVRLTGPGTNAKRGIAVAGTVFDDVTGEPVVGGGDGSGGLKLGEEYSEIIQVGTGGVVKFDVRRAEAVLLEVGGDEEGECADEGDGESGGDANDDDANDDDDDDDDGSQDDSTNTPGISGSWRAELCWGNLVFTALVGLAGIL